MAIHCCKGCVAPKRFPGCHASCPEYLHDKAEHDRRKAVYAKERDIDCAIIGNRGKKVYEALKNKRYKKV